MIRYIYPNINCVQLTGLYRLLQDVCRDNNANISEVTSKKRDDCLVRVRAKFVDRAMKIENNKSEIMRHLNRHPSTVYNYIEVWLK